MDVDRNKPGEDQHTPHAEWAGDRKVEKEEKNTEHAERKRINPRK